MATTESNLRDLMHADIAPESSHSSDPKDLLRKLQFSETAQHMILDPDSFSTEHTGLSGIESSNELLIQVRNSLTAIIDSVGDNPSILSRATACWGKLSLSEKIIGGLALSGPTLAVGLAANIGFLLTLSSVSVGAYITGSMVLDDHLLHTKNMTQKLKEGVFAIADVLVLTIAALDVIRKKLETEVKKFQEENRRLSDNINGLASEVDNLRVQIESNRNTERFLRKTRTELEATSERLAEDLDTHRDEYQKTQLQIEHFKKDHERIVATLSTEVSTLTEKRVALEFELQKTRSLATTLQGTVVALSSAVLSDKKQKQAFQDKLETFLSSEEKSFGAVATRMGETETDLSSVKSRLEESLKRHERLMKQQSILISRLELLDKSVSEEDPSNTVEKSSNTEILRSIGFMPAPHTSKAPCFRPEDNPTAVDVM